MSVPFRLIGLIAAPHTPFTASGELNPSVIADQAALLIESGVAGAFVCGSTGEAHSLTTEERQRVTEEWVRVVGGRLKLLVHAGHNCRADAVRLASHAARAGADAVAAVAPSYFKPATVDDLIAFCEPVAAAAAGLPFYLYDIPVMTGVSLPTAEFLDRAADRIPNLAGVKYTNGDLVGLQECLAVRGGRFDVVFGYDEMLLAGLALGVKGAIGSTYNFAAPLYLRLLRAFESGDLAAARRAQLTSVGLIRVMGRFGGLRAGKAIMGLLGVDCGPVRSPMRPMTPAEVSALHEALRPFDMFARPIHSPGVVRV
ncbi:MAG TPA: dihydrodipicolinate synthase family protein [Gemmataceae bacterium]|nr:dihydrodipicolinate synthase family protein [Gemmataceae bacterium]